MASERVSPAHLEAPAGPAGRAELTEEDRAYLRRLKQEGRWLFRIEFPLRL